jgi:hypothetical protein
MVTRDSVRIFALSLFTPTATVVVGSVDASWPATTKAVAAFVLVPVLIVPLVYGIALIVPRRYWSNPDLDRSDVTLGSLTALNLALFAAPTSLAFFTHPDSTPAVALVVAGCLVTALAAGGLHRVVRSRFSSAWTDPKLSASSTPVGDSIGTPGDEAVRIRATPVTRWFIVIFLGAIALFMAGFAVQGFGSAASVSVVLMLLALTLAGLAAAVWRVEAGCDASHVWIHFAFNRKTADRSILRAYVWLPSLSGYGSLRLIDASGALALTIPTAFFKDRDLKRLIAALQLPPAA